jgi:O-antigen ligase
MNRLTRAGLVVLFAILPLYGTFAQLAPDTPGIPPLLPRASAAVVAVVGLTALLAVVPVGLRAARRDALTFAFLAPGLATIAAAIPGFDPLLGIGLGVFVTGFGLVALALYRRADAETARMCIRVFLCSAVVAALLALAMLLTRRPASLYAFYHARAVGTFLNPNELAAYTMIALGVAVPLAVASRGRDRLATAAAVVLAVTLAATFSRWGLFATVCGIAAYGLFARARTVTAVAVAVAVLGIGLNAALGATHHNPRDTEARTVAWRTGLATFARFPLLGTGPLAFPRTYEEMRPPDAPGNRTAVAFDPHSLPIAFAAEGGIVAVVTLVLSFTIVLRTALREAGGASARPRMLMLAVAAALVALMVHASINTLSLFFPLGLQVVPLALAVVRTNALR